MLKWVVECLQVIPRNEGQRLDQFLAENCSELSRTVAKKVIDLGGVHLNGRRIRNCSQRVKCADSVEIYLDRQPLVPWRISEGDIVFQDRYLIVLNKPAMIETQPTHARFKGTLYEALQWHLRDPFRPQLKPELGMVQRLDRGTSGLITFSIHPRAHKRMTQFFLEHQVEKRYLALVNNIPEPQSGEIISSLARSRHSNRVKSVAKGGKPAITRFQLVEQLADCALLDIELLTGRSHQIRAHMSEYGCPLLGDQRYGGPTQVAGLEIVRPLLHATKLAFRHPVNDQQLNFTLPLPDDMVKVMERIKAD